MTDSSALIANKQALSSDVLYNLKPSLVRCRQYRASIPASNKSSWGPGESVINFIPARRNAFLDTKNSYIRYTLSSTDTTNIQAVDGSAYSLINRMDVYHGSNMLETIQSYNVLAAYLIDFQMSQATRAGLESCVGCTTTRAGTALSVSTGATRQQTFCIPIISGVVGNMVDKMLPLSLADDIRVEFLLESLTQSVVSPAATSWNIVSWELELSILELSDEGMRMVEQITPFSQPIYIHGSSYRHTPTTQLAVAGSFSSLISFRHASLKQIICCPRRNTEIALQTAYSISSRINPNIDSYYFRVGSLCLPQKPIMLANANTTGGYAEGFMELLRSQHSNTDLGFAPSISRALYNVADVATNYGVVGPGLTNGSYANAFAIAQEFESISNRSDVILSGTNTLNLQIFHDYTITTAPGAVYTMNYFALFDHLITLDPTGLLSCRW